MSQKDNSAQLAELESAKDELKACMGVDPVRAVQVSKRIMELRASLRNDRAMIEHLASVVKGKHA